MTKNKIKTILITVALVLIVALAAGFITHFVRNRNTDNPVSENNAFTVTPQNKSPKIKLMSRASFEDGDSEPYGVGSYTLIADTSHYDGDIAWTVSWTGEEVYWNDSEKQEEASSCVTLTQIDNRSVRVDCLQPFGQPIAITATLVDRPAVFEVCVCNYKQTYVLDKIQIGFNSFLADGSLGRGALAPSLGIVPAPISLHDEQTLDYSCILSSSSYTEAAQQLTSYPELYFTLTPDADVIEAFGLDKFNFKSFSGKFENALSGTLDGFFDSSWCEYAVNGTAYTVEDFAYELCYAENEDGFAIDSVPMYTLTIFGLANGTVTYDYNVDLYALNEQVAEFASISLNRSELLFGGN